MIKHLRAAVERGELAIPGLGLPSTDRARLPRRLTPKRALLFALQAIVLVHLVFMTTTSILLVAFTIGKPGATVLMLYRKFAFGHQIAMPRWIDYEDVPDHLKRMLVSVEDGGFWSHRGIEPAALKYAWEIDRKIGRPLYGGSTLTMQLARTLFLVPEKLYVRKYLEIIIALEMHVLMPKTRQLELYFNFAEWGRGMFGIESASHAYFKASSRKISRERGARLIALLSSPVRYTPETLWKNKILAQRYAYLSRKYLEQPKPAAPAPQMPAEPIPEKKAGESATETTVPPIEPPVPEEGKKEDPPPVQSP